MLVVRSFPLRHLRLHCGSALFRHAVGPDILSEFEDGWIVEDAEWAAAAGSKEKLLTCLTVSEEGRLVKVAINNNS